MFVLIAELEARPEQSRALENLLRALVDCAEHEPGILFYAVQRPEGETGRFILCEYYEDKKAWQAHLEHPPAKEKLRQFDTLLKAPPKLTFCEALAATSFGGKRSGAA